MLMPHMKLGYVGRKASVTGIWMEAGRPCLGRSALGAAGSAQLGPEYAEFHNDPDIMGFCVLGY